MSTYDAAFFDYVNSGSLYSAKQVLGHIAKHVRIASVLDVGCGEGAWLSAWTNLGVEDIAGIDGDYVERKRLLIPGNSFIPTDLGKPFSLGRKFDLVQSLEVAEHLPESRAAGFVGDITRHGDLVLFSAAAKGQGGHNHVNEQDYEYWRRLFADHGYAAIDFLRPLLSADKGIEPWYRYNCFLYASPERLAALPPPIQACRVPESQRLTDISPSAYRVRKALISVLPVSTVTWLAKVKERYVARVRRW